MPETCPGKECPGEAGESTGLGESFDDGLVDSRLILPSIRQIAREVGVRHIRGSDGPVEVNMFVNGERDDAAYLDVKPLDLL